jgi:hypothetical protein
MSKPAKEWVPKPDAANDAPPPLAAPGVHELFRVMSEVPCGMQMLHAASGDAQKLSSPEFAAMKAFWRADAALEKETDPAVKTWLEGAKTVAQHKLHNPDGGVDGLPPKQVAAFNAVRNGMTSNAPGSPFDQHDQRLRTVLEGWTQPPSTLQQVLPISRQTPFHPKALAMSMDMAEAFGLKSLRTKTVEESRAGAAKLAAAAAVDMAAPTDIESAPAPHPARMRAAAIASFIEEKGLDATGGLRLKSGDLETLKADLAQHAGDGWTGLSAECERALATAARSKKPVQAHELLQEGARELALSGANSLQVEGHASEAKKHHAALAMNERQHVETLLHTTVEGIELRNKMRLSSGGTAGVGIPAVLPHPPQLSGVSLTPSLSANYSQKREEVVQLFMPILGLELLVGQQTVHSGDATVGMAVSGGGDVVKGAATASAKASVSQTQLDGTMLRLFRRRNEDEALRGRMNQVVTSMVHWDAPGPDGQPAFDSPMEAVLAQNPEVSVSQFQSYSVSAEMAPHVAAGLAASATVLEDKGDPPKKMADAGGAGRVGAGAAISRTWEMRNEIGGVVPVMGEKGSSGRAKLAAEGFVPLAALRNQAEARLGPPANQAESQVSLPPDHRWAVGSGPAIPLSASGTRDTYVGMEKNSISPFLIGDAQDGDLDRTYQSPRDMLAEMKSNREMWIHRGLEVMTPNAEGVKDTPENRREVEKLLTQFESDVQHLTQTSQFCQYNVNYSIRPEASNWIDGLRAIEQLGKMAGDQKAVQTAATAIDATWASETTWRPLMLIVREKGKDSLSAGVNAFGVARSLAEHATEGQRTAAQFPPP